MAFCTGQRHSKCDTLWHTQTHPCTPRRNDGKARQLCGLLSLEFQESPSPYPDEKLHSAQPWGQLYRASSSRKGEGDRGPPAGAFGWRSPWGGGRKGGSGLPGKQNLNQDSRAQPLPPLRVWPFLGALPQDFPSQPRSLRSTVVKEDLLGKANASLPLGIVSFCFSGTAKKNTRSWGEGGGNSARLRGERGK